VVLAQNLAPILPGYLALYPAARLIEATDSQPAGGTSIWRAPAEIGDYAGLVARNLGKARRILGSGLPRPARPPCFTPRTWPISTPEHEPGAEPRWNFTMLGMDRRPLPIPVLKTCASKAATHGIGIALCPSPSSPRRRSGLLERPEWTAMTIMHSSLAARHCSHRCAA
jgi:hypothetical protein